MIEPRPDVTYIRRAFEDLRSRGRNVSVTTAGPKVLVSKNCRRLSMRAGAFAIMPALLIKTSS